MKKRSDVNCFLKSQDDDATTFEVAWQGVFVGQIIVPCDDTKSIKFSTYSGINTAYAKRIAYYIYERYTRNISVKTPRKQFELTGENFVKKAQVYTDTKKEWKKYYNFMNVYMGKYCEFDCDGKTCMELCLKKIINEDDAFLVISTFLKKYPMVRFTISQIAPNPVDIDKSMSEKDIRTILVSVLEWNKIKSCKKQSVISIVKREEVQTHPEEPRVPKTNIDPMIMLKTLTLTMGNKQTIEDAKKKAQIKANEQYMFIKLLDKDGIFVCNIYPDESAKKLQQQRLNDLAQKVIGD